MPPQLWQLRAAPPIKKKGRSLSATPQSLLSAEADVLAHLPFLQASRNFLRAAPCSFCASASCEHLIEIADFGLVPAAAGAAGAAAAGAAGAAAAAGAAGAIFFLAIAGEPAKPRPIKAVAITRVCAIFTIYPLYSMSDHRVNFTCSPDINRFFTNWKPPACRTLDYD